jgi:hypothetical protein
VKAFHLVLIELCLLHRVSAKLNGTDRISHDCENGQVVVVAAVRSMEVSTILWRKVTGAMFLQVPMIF